MRLDVQFREDANKRFAEHVLSLCDGEAIPSRTKFDPCAITDYLPHLILFEVTPSNEIFERMVGTAVLARRGQEPSETCISVSKQCNDVTDVRPDVVQAVKHRSGYRLVNREARADGRTVLVEDVGFPLANKEGKPSFVVALSREVAADDGDSQIPLDGDTPWLEHQFLNEIADEAVDQPDTNGPETNGNGTSSEKRIGSAFARLLSARRAA